MTGADSESIHGAARRGRVRRVKVVYARTRIALGEGPARIGLVLVGAFVAAIVAGFSNVS